MSGWLWANVVRLELGTLKGLNSDSKHSSISMSYLPRLVPIQHFDTSFGAVDKLLSKHRLTWNIFI